MAAPAALAYSKLIYPETEASKTSAKQIKNINTKLVKQYFFEVSNSQYKINYRFVPNQLTNTKQL